MRTVWLIFIAVLPWLDVRDVTGCVAGLEHFSGCDYCALGPRLTPMKDCIRLLAHA